MEISKQEIFDLMQKYEATMDTQEAPEKKIEGEGETQSKEYLEFKKENMPRHLSWYEKAANYTERMFKMKVDPKKAAKLQEAIDMCHLRITPAGAVSFSVLLPMVLMLVGTFVSFIFFGSTFFGVFFLITGAVLINPLQKIPYYFAAEWRMAASNQMVLCIFYVVTYMRHTSNLEKAIEFASEHLSPPLSLDLRKVLWDVETEKFESVKESLDIYLEGWRQYNMEFLEAFHLIESSLYESSEDRRLGLLDKSLDVILDETYEKMLHYAQNLRNPITTLYMMGIILPILGLVVLPLMVSFMEGVQWYHIATLYDIVLPITVYYMGKNILVSRPTGYGDTSSATAQAVQEQKLTFSLGRNQITLTPLHLAMMLGVILFIIALVPLIIHLLAPGFDLPPIGGFSFLEYKTNDATGEIVGPFGFFSSLISFFIPLSLGLSVGIYYKIISKDLIKIREKGKKLEQEFASALFQLGNRLGDGIPIELAVGKVADVMEGTTSGNFFRIVTMNIRKLGMGIKDAIFNERTGAIVYFPSDIITSSMKVLIQAISKGPKVAAQALVNISRYIKEIHNVDERLRDILSDIIAGIKSQINFLTPVIAGIVIGITSMITNILGKLSSQIKTVSAEGAGAQAASLANLFGLGIPTYYFQIVVGIYVVEIIYILTIIANGIENGKDPMNEKYLLGSNMVRSTIMYCSIAFVIMLLFNFIANQILGATLT